MRLANGEGLCPLFCGNGDSRGAVLEPRESKGGCKKVRIGQVGRGRVHRSKSWIHRRLQREPVQGKDKGKWQEANARA